MCNAVVDHMECVAAALFTADTDDISVLLLLPLLPAHHWPSQRCILPQVLDGLLRSHRMVCLSVYVISVDTSKAFDLIIINYSTNYMHFILSRG